jgi:hypothetical protein
MGGSTWKENGDGTYTQLDRDTTARKGFSWLGLYLMGSPNLTRCRRSSSFATYNALVSRRQRASDLQGR